MRGSRGYNARRPHQSLGMQVPADRFLTRAAATRRAEAEQLLSLKLPANLTHALSGANLRNEDPRYSPIPCSAMNSFS